MTDAPKSRGVQAVFRGGPEDGRVLTIEPTRVYLFPVVPASSPLSGSFDRLMFDNGFVSTSQQVHYYERALDPDLGHPSIDGAGNHRYEYRGIR